MRRLARSIIFLSCGYAAACGGDGGKDPVDTDDTSGGPPQILSVSPDPLVEGQVAVLTGTNFSANTASNTVTFDNVALLVTAASTTSLTVTIPEGCGPLRVASLQVTVGGVTSSTFSATVAPDPAGDAIQNVALAVGEQVVFRQQKYCLDLATDGGAAQYVVGVQSTGQNGEHSLEVRVSGIVSGASVAGAPMAVSAPPVTAAAVSPRFSPLRGDLGASPAFGLIQRHREAHRAVMADLIRPVGAGALRFGALSPQRAPARTIVDGNESVGDQVELRVRLLGDDCSEANTVTVTAELKVKTIRSMWWVDVDNPPDGFLDADLQGMGTFFDDVIWATEVAEFGNMGDLDGNQRVVILITKEVNANASSGGQLLGFVNPCDLFLRDDAMDFVASNEGEFFYAIAPDPEGIVGDTVATADWLEVMPIIITHEYTHIIQFSRRVGSATALNFMASFVVEGQATLAEEIVGHVVLQNGVGQDLDAVMALDIDEVQVYPWYFAPFIDLAFYFGWPGERDIPRVEGAPQECTWIAIVEHPCGGRPLWYGGTWSFLRWASDLYGAELGGSDTFHKALIDGDLSGFDNLEQALASQGTLEDHLARWAATLYMDGRPGASPENSMSSWDLLSFQEGLVDTAWLHPIEHGFFIFADTVTVREPSTAYFLIGGFGNSSFTLQVGTPSGGGLPPDMQVWLVRTQ